MLIMHVQKVTGYCVFVRGNIIFQHNKKKKCYNRIQSWVCELCLKQLLKCHGLDHFGINVNFPMKMYRDNNAAVCIANISVSHQRTKHIKIYCYYARDLVQKDIVSTVYVASNFRGTSSRHLYQGSAIEFLLDAMTSCTWLTPIIQLDREYKTTY